MGSSVMTQSQERQPQEAGKGRMLDSSTIPEAMWGEPGKEGRVVEEPGGASVMSSSKGTSLPWSRTSVSSG